MNHKTRALGKRGRREQFRRTAARCGSPKHRLFAGVATGRVYYPGQIEVRIGGVKIDAIENVTMTERVLLNRTVMTGAVSSIVAIKTTATMSRDAFDAFSEAMDGAPLEPDDIDGNA